MFKTVVRPVARPVIKKPFILDTFNPDDVLFSFSIARALSSFSSPLQIRRGSDSAVLNVGYPGGVIDEQAIKNFGGYNLLGYTEDLTNGFYLKSRASISLVNNITVNGNNVFDFSELTTDKDEHYLQATLNNLGNNVLYTVSAIVKSNTRSKVRVGMFMPGHGVAVQHFNLANGTIIDTNDPQNIASSIEPFGSDGFYKISLTMMSGTNTLVKPQIVILNNNNTPTYVGNGKGLFISSLQVEANQLPTTYQPRTAGGASDCFVASYQNVSDEQPKIYDVLTGEMVKENGKPAIMFDGLNDNVEIPNVAGNSVIDAYFVNRHDDTSTTAIDNEVYLYPTGNGAGNFGFVGSKNSTLVDLNSSSYGSPSLYKNNLELFPTNRGEVYSLLGQTQNIVNHQRATTSNWTEYKYGRYDSGGGIFHFEGTLQEIIIFKRVLSNDERNRLHNDIMDFYKILN